MLKKISDHWWMLSYDGEEGRFVWFGYTEGAVKQKFASWMTKASMGRLIRHSPITGSRCETAYNYGSRR
jgi:hypothetical protein